MNLIEEFIKLYPDKTEEIQRIADQNQKSLLRILRHKELWELIADSKINLPFFINTTDENLKAYKKLLASKTLKEIIKDKQSLFESAIRNVGLIEPLACLNLCLSLGIKINDNAVEEAALSGNLKLVKYLLEHGGKINDNAVEQAALSGNLKLVKYLVEHGGKINDYQVKLAVNSRNFDYVKYLVEHGAKINDDALEEAALSGDFEIVKYLLEHGGKINAKTFKLIFQKGEFSLLELIKEKYQSEDRILDLVYLVKKQNIKDLDNYLNQNYVITPELIFKAALLNHDTKMAGNLLNENNIKLDEFIIIGLTNISGEWSGSVVQVAKAWAENEINVYYLPINLKDASNMALMSSFSGFINPGAGDNFPKDREFSLNDLNQDKMLENEHLYQKIVTYAKENRIPYLGICSGSQHLLLNSGGQLNYLKNLGLDYLGGNHDAIFVPTTIPHYMTLNNQEKLAALENCEFPQVEFPIYTAHNYAGIDGKLGERIDLGAISEEGVVQSFSYGARYIGTQFHPEVVYSDEEYNRQKILLDNFLELAKTYHEDSQYAKKEGIDLNQMLDKYDNVLLSKLKSCKKIAVTIKPMSKKTYFDLEMQQNFCPIEDEKYYKYIKISKEVSPLAIAASRDNLPLVEELINKGENVNSIDSPLAWAAASSQNPKILTTLIEAGAQFEQKDNFGYSPLEQAVLNGNLRAVDILLKAGVNPLSLQGNSAFYNDEKIFSLLIESVEQKDYNSFANLIKYHSHLKEKITNYIKEEHASFIINVHSNDPLSIYLPSTNYSSSINYNNQVITGNNHSTNNSSLFNLVPSFGTMALGLMSLNAITHFSSEGINFVKKYNFSSCK